MTPVWSTEYRRKMYRCRSSASQKVHKHKVLRTLTLYRKPHPQTSAHRHLSFDVSLPRKATSSTKFLPSLDAPCAEDYPDRGAHKEKKKKVGIFTRHQEPRPIICRSCLCHQNLAAKVRGSRCDWRRCHWSQPVTGLRSLALLSLFPLFCV